MGTRLKGFDLPERLTISSASSRWAERATQALRSLRRSFARERLLANLKTLLTVAPLTVLVWIYAEQQQLVTEQDVPVRITAASADPARRVVNLLSPADGTVRVTLKGSQGGIDRVKALMRQTFVTQALEVDVADGLPISASQPLVTLDEIAGNRLFYSQGVTVIACSPQTLTVRVDALEDRKAPVRVPADAPGLIKAIFTPASVVAHGPSLILDTLARRGQLVAVADLMSEPALKQPGEHKTLSIHLQPMDNVTLTPDTVTADLTVGQADQTLTVSPVPVKVLATKWLMDNYKFDYKEVLAGPVTLIGPPQQIALVDPHNPKLIAVVAMDNTDVAIHGPRPKPVVFQDNGLPEGVRVKPDGTPPTIQIAVDPR